jgi:prevent-host-death family protein
MSETLRDDTPPNADLLEHETPPEGGEIGLREARARLGTLADKARWRDEVTYLTKNGTRVAAVVPAAAARTLAQTTEAIQERREEEERGERHLADVIAEFRRQFNTRGAAWAHALLELCVAVEDLADADPARADLALRRVQDLREHAAAIVAGKRAWGE